MTSPLTLCSRPGCTLPAFVTHHENGKAVELCYACYDAMQSHGAIVRGSDGRRYEVVADSLDLELGEARREIERLAAQVAEVNVALCSFEHGEIHAETFSDIIRMIIFPESVNDDDLEWGKRKLAELKAQGQGAK